MLNKVSIRLRLTIMIVILLIICCVGLTIILNFSADKMATQIEASKITNAYIAKEDETASEMESIPTTEIEVPLQTLDSSKPKAYFRIESIVYLVIVIVCGGSLTYYISKKALQPLDILNGQIKNINVHNLSEALPIQNTNDEIADITKSFNEMTEKLNNSFIMQERFSASAAHELRTPLTVLQTKVDVFKKKNIHTAEEYDNIIYTFEKQIKRLRLLVSSLLDMTNMEDNFEKSNICIKSICEEIILEFEDIAKSKNINISLDCNSDITILENVDLLYRVIYNLIENAINYNKENGKIDIIVNRLSDNQISIKIKDTGIGITDENKKHIFESFYRVDESRSRKMGGAGLGLSIVQSIILKMNGTIYVTDNEDVGSCFNIILK